MNPADVAIVGGGIVGLATALAVVERHHRTVVVLEKEPVVGGHQTSHNSGVIHAGLYYRPGSHKARLCRSGLGLLYRFCEEEGVPHRRCGKLVVAVDGGELARLDALEARGRANGVALRRVRREELSEHEPNVVGVAGLWVEETGVVDFAAVARALAARIERLGGAIRLGHRVLAIRRDGSRFAIETTGGLVDSGRLIGCAGLQADRVARLAGVEPTARIVPFRGEYYRLRERAAGLIRGLIYPVPDPSLPFLGVHFTRRIDGVVDAGPNAILAPKREGYRRGEVSLRDLGELLGFPGFWRLAAKHWRSGAAEVARSRSLGAMTRSLRRLVPGLRREDVIRDGAGVRAQAVGADGSLIDAFLIAEHPGGGGGGAGGGLHLLNAPSPAATASLAIGRVLAERLLGPAVTASRESPPAG
jgi:L-2-hydroxyglutarate oxidase